MIQDQETSLIIKRNDMLAFARWCLRLSSRPLQHAQQLCSPLQIMPRPTMPFLHQCSTLPCVWYFLIQITNFETLCLCVNVFLCNQLALMTPNWNSCEPMIARAVKHFAESLVRSIGLMKKSGCRLPLNRHTLFDLWFSVENQTASNDASGQAHKKCYLSRKVAAQLYLEYEKDHLNLSFDNVVCPHTRAHVYCEYTPTYIFAHFLRHYKFYLNSHIYIRTVQ